MNTNNSSPVELDGAAVLVVDDDHHVRDIVSRTLRPAGCLCSTAASAGEAKKLLASSAFDLVTLDISMPGQSGIELLHDIHEAGCDAAVIMLTGRAGVETAIDALTHGASDFLFKPIDREELVSHAATSLKRRKAILKRRDRVVRLESEARQQRQDLRSAREDTVQRLLSASRYRDEETGAHIKRVGLFAAVLADAAGWQRSDVETIRLAAPMHDVGKIGIPDAILQKPGQLTEAEYAIMKTHTVIGERMLAGGNDAVMEMACQIARSHHERWDGRGYPEGLAGPQIPEAARIVSIVDVYDALTHDRVYRPAFEETKALQILDDGCGSQFDARLLDLFLTTLPEIQLLNAEHPDEDADSDFNENPRVEPEELLTAVPT